MSARQVGEFAAGVLLVGGVMLGLLALVDHVLTAGAIPGWLPVSAAAVLLLYPAGWVVRRGAPGHAHGGARGQVATHEAGHVVAARALGGRVLSAELHRDGGGLVTWDMPARVAGAKTNVAFLLAGQYAAGTSRGCGGDRAAVRRELRQVPAAERAAVRAAADRRARQIVSSSQGEIRRIAAQLDEKGRL